MNLNLKDRPSFGNINFVSILEKYDYKVQSGDILAGLIIGVERNYFLVDIGFNKISFLPEIETSIKPVKNLNLLFPIYDKIEVLITFFIKKKLFFVSMKQIKFLYLWKRVTEMNFINTIFYGKLEKSSWRGKLINFDGLNLFLPNYHLSKYYKKKKPFSRFLGLKFLAITSNTYLIIVNSRFANLKLQSYLIQLGISKIGYIRNIIKFGLFVNVNGLKSLLHVSEISNQKLRNLNNLYKKGKRFKIKIVYYKINEGRIAVSTKN